MAPISNDLLLAAALSSGIPAAMAQSAPNAGVPRTGVATTVKTGEARSSTTMYIDGTTNQRLTTDANSTMHVLFSDQSAVTLGPNSELMIAKYEFNPQVKQGQILLDLTKGLLRVVGGLISKNTPAVVRTSTATIGIRGGITSIQLTNNTPTGAPGPADQVNSTFLFGQDMTVQGTNGGALTVNRPGFSVNSTPQGLGSPFRASTESLGAQLQGFQSRPQGGGSQPGGGGQAGGGGQPGGGTQPPPRQLISTSDRPASGGGNLVNTLSSQRMDSNSGSTINVQGSVATGNTNVLGRVLASSNTVTS